MQLVREVDRLPSAARGRVLASGQFDGVHAGHQRVLRRLQRLATEQQTESVIVLEPVAPGAVVLTTLRQRLRLLAACAPTWVVLRRPAGPGLAAVADRAGAALLVTAADSPPADWIATDRVPTVCADGVPLSAQHLIARLATGDLHGVAHALGRPHAVEGRVVHGFHRGAPLGIPTANLRLRDIAVPPDGVYAVRARWRDAPLTGVANIGFNPTFGNRTRSVEVHLFDFAADLYGQRLEVAFIARLRGEQKFADIDALLAQIRADIAAARAALAPETHE